MYACRNEAQLFWPEEAHGTNLCHFSCVGAMASLGVYSLVFATVRMFV